MKIQTINDLHTEFGHYPFIEKAGDVLCVAGDLCAWNTREEGLDWLKKQALQFDQVFFIPGNHEHYGNRRYREVRDFWETAFIGEENIHFPRHGVEHEGIMFIGDTLWTDLGEGDPLAVMDYRQFMNDAFVVNHVTYREENRLHKLAIEQALLENKDKPVVVMTHHLPCYEVISPQWQGSRLNPCFANSGTWAQDLVYKYNNILLWHFGHTHDSVDMELGGCRFVCNPYGYYGRAINKEYNPIKVIEV